MNERLRELAEQAQQYAEHTTPQGLEWFDTFKEKFAELIISECVDVADKETMDDTVGYSILKHFGVE